MSDNTSAQNIIVIPPGNSWQCQRPTAVIAVRASGGQGSLRKNDQWLAVGITRFCYLPRRPILKAGDVLKTDEGATVFCTIREVPQ